ncbi:MAG: organic hydroperoxide resistance protein [Hyphomicrobiaceae bacterium]|nr:organic hydroperoxide resistance protein [Hyphomicrobiaceae bacterium]
MATYTATTKGGRDGKALLEPSNVGFAMALPKELGGSGEGFNPEQLFALGYSSCFGQAVLALAKKHGVDAGPARVTAAVTLNKDDGGGFALSVELKVQIPGADRDKVEALVHDAHTICPYSKATRGNIPVTLTVL